MSKYPQYARSTDPEVIATIKRNEKHEKEFRVQCANLSEKYTGDRGNAWVSRSGSGSYLTGLRMTDEQVEAAPGQWRKPGRYGQRRPYQSNPIAPEFNLRSKHETVPGRPDILRSEYDSRTGQSWMGSGAVFLHDGAAWSGCGFTPEDPADERWTEVLASELHAALEAVNAR